jgi:glycosyltransferase involved in cell wall biosynthesis
MLDQRPLISVILACYNHEKFVAEAINGVLSQSYSPLEVVIFDDCSPDGTAEVIERTIANHPRRSDVQFVPNNKNIGGHAVSEIGLRMVKGNFLFITCGDDIMLPDMIEEVASVWMNERVSLVTANAYYIDEESKSLNRTFRDPSETADDSFETLARDGSNACCFGPGIGFDREIYDKFGFVPSYMKVYDVIYPFYAYLLNGARFIPRPLVKYRIHANNASLSLQEERADEAEKARIKQRQYLQHLGFAVLMEEVLDRLQNEQPGRYRPIGERIIPLLNIQLAEQAKKLVRSRRVHGGF